MEIQSDIICCSAIKAR